ncbi:MAG: 3'3'-cGAMP-specific phosphodiesterase 3 [Phycisphaerae bacterium]|nr:MAG: 3'3'-cGAMP-specific phosphodiesterase 3 [Phycisphaerae bacterium]
MNTAMNLIGNPSGSLPSSATASLQSTQIRLSGVISAMSYALDITEGQPEGHAVRTCLIGMRMAKELRLTNEESSALFYALQLKDLGCSSNAGKMSQLLSADDRSVKRDFKTVNACKLFPKIAYIWRSIGTGASWAAKVARLVKIGMAGEQHAKEFIQLRCERGAQIASSFLMPDDTANAIRALDEHWDGKGYPDGLKGDQIPLLGRILCLAQTVEVFHTNYGLDAAMEMAVKRRGAWFDPNLVRVLLSIRSDATFWSRLETDNIHAHVAEFEPVDEIVHADDQRLDRIAEGFATVIDVKSSWTYRHSRGVTELATGIAGVMGFTGQELIDIRRAALLHDIGKLGVSNLILDKPAKLTDTEYAEMREHAAHTYHILSRVNGFSHLADLAGAHHERLDGNGYFRGWGANELTTPMRILAVADMCEAMSAERPYRDTMPMEKVLGLLDKDKGSAICPSVYHALKFYLDTHRYEPSRLIRD